MAVVLPPHTNTSTTSTTPTTTTTTSSSTSSTDSSTTSSTTSSTMISFPNTTTTTSSTTTWSSSSTTTSSTTTSTTTTTTTTTDTTTPATTRRTTTDPPRTTTVPITTPIATSAIPPTTFSTHPVTNSIVPSTASSISVPVPTSVNSSTGLPKVAVIGIAVAGVIVVGFLVTVLVIKYTRHKKFHKALDQDDLFDNLPIDPPMGKLHTHHTNNHTSDYYQDDMHGQELEPMYQNGGEYSHMQHHHHHHYDGNHDHDGNLHHDPSSNMQQDHPGHHDYHQGFQNDGHGYHGDNGQGVHTDGPGYQGDGHGFHGGDSHGFQGDSHGFDQGGNGHGFDQGGNGHGFDQGGNGQGFGQGGNQGFGQGGNQGFGQGGNQGFGNHGGAGQGPSGQGFGSQGFQGGDGSFGHAQPTTTPGNTDGVRFIEGTLQMIPPAPLVTKPKKRPESSNQYNMLTPSSPTNTTFSGEGLLIDETALPAQGSSTIAPLPLDYRTSISSSGSWNDKDADYGYSPQSKQALLNQSRFYEATSQHSSGRVLPTPSPRIATIPVAQSAGIRAPQDPGHVEPAAPIVSPGGNVSMLNTFDRRHPQSNEGGEGRDSVFYVSESSRNPQDNH